jgi:hypothetical protein
VVGLRQKFRNIHVVLSRPPVERPLERLRYAVFSAARVRCFQRSRA